MCIILPARLEGMAGLKGVIGEHLSCLADAFMPKLRGEARQEGAIAPVLQ